MITRPDERRAGTLFGRLRTDLENRYCVDFANCLLDLRVRGLDRGALGAMTGVTVDIRFSSDYFMEINPSRSRTVGRSVAIPPLITSEDAAIVDSCARACREEYELWRTGRQRRREIVQELNATQEREIEDLNMSNNIGRQSALSDLLRELMNNPSNRSIGYVHDYDRDVLESTPCLLLSLNGHPRPGRLMHAWVVQ